MKTLLFLISLAATVVSSFAQGTLNFSNLGVGLDAPVTNWDGTPLAGSMFAADLWWAPGYVTDSQQLIELGAPAVFFAEGYFLGGTRTIPGTMGGSVVTLQVRALGGVAGCPPFAWDCDSSVFQEGDSALMQVTLTSPPDPPASLKGLTPFGISPPTTRSAPRCIVNSVVGNRLVLSWPPSIVAGSFVLQQNSDLTTTNWVTITETPVLVGPEFQIAVPVPRGNMFYRLVAE